MKRPEICCSAPRKPSRTACWSQCGTRVRDWRRKLWSASSTPSTRPRPTAWGWGCRSVARSSKRMVDDCGRPPTRPAAPSFNSLCRPIQSLHDHLRSMKPRPERYARSKSFPGDAAIGNITGTFSCGKSDAAVAWSHDEDRTRRAPDDGGRRQGGDGGSHGFFCKPLKMLDSEKEMKGKERNGGGDRERTPPKCGQVDACLYLSIIESQWCSVTELAWQYIDSVSTNT